MTLENFFEKYSRVAIAFSGGVDSAYLFYMAVKYAKKVQAYYVKSEFQPQFELEDALKLAEETGGRIKVLKVAALETEGVKENPSNRCYFCKKGIFGAILEEAKKDGFSVILDGTNASDMVEDRPGMKALKELSVLSPLRLCGLTKEEIRKLSKEAGLFTWDKPAYACLATRIPTGEEITQEKLKATETAEDYLFSLGFVDFRVRYRNKAAVIQVPANQWTLVEQHREKILQELKKHYTSVLLDLKLRD